MDLLTSIGKAARAAGGEAYLVGGAVRDGLLSRPVKDHDVLVTGVPRAALAATLGNVARVDEVGASFGVLKVTAGGETVDVALPRAAPGLPEHAMGVEADLARRDFTMNAMARRLSDGVLVDPHGGERDARAGLVRAVGDPAERFREDPLRMLRAVRFEATLGFALEPATARAVANSAGLMETVAPERAGAELLGTLSGEKPRAVLRALRDMRDLGLLGRVVPELAASFGFDQRNRHHNRTVDEHVFAAVGYAAGRGASPRARLALLLHDVGKPACFSLDGRGQGHFYRHEEVGAEMARAALERLKFSNDTVDSVALIVAEHMNPPRRADARVLRRWMNRLGEAWADALDCREADLAAHKPEQGFDPRAWAEGVRERCGALAPVATFDERGLALRGEEIATLFGVAGAGIGRLKRRATQAVVDGAVPNEREALLEWLRREASG